MTSSKLLLALAIATAFSFVQPVKAARRVDAGPSYVNAPVPVPDAGSTLPLLGSALLAVAGLRRKLSR
jgi:protein with PEP-CTERM/exosortase system signal